MIKKILYLLACLIVVSGLCTGMMLYVLSLHSHTFPIIPNFLNINVTINPGISFGFLTGHSHILIGIIQLCVSLLIIIFATIWFKKWYYLIPLYCSGVGGIFNFIDRMFININIDCIAHSKNHEVLDYFQFKGFLSWFSSVFNLPDVFISLGLFVFVVVFIIFFIFGRDYEKNKPVSLFIDTTQKYFNLIILQDEEIIYSYSIKTNNNMTDIVVEKVKKIFSKLGIPKESVNEILVTDGPGSFTGCRIGILIAKTFKNFNNNISLKTISSSLFFSNGNDITILDARGGKYFTSIVIDNYIKEEVKILDINEIKEKASNCKLTINYDGLTNKNVNQKLKKHLSHFYNVSAEELEPNYIKNV